MEDTEKTIMPDSVPASGYKKNMGENLRHIRRILRVKQETLAELSGYSQSMISSFENREFIDADTLQRIALALKVPAELIENFDLEGIIYNIQNNYAPNAQQSNEGDYAFSSTSQITNTMDVIKFALESNQRLYERMLSEQKAEIKELKAALRNAGLKK